VKVKLFRLLEEIDAMHSKAGQTGNILKTRRLDAGKEWPVNEVPLAEGNQSEWM
jgi:hypothetical protein